jgi:repressor LexA|tara:strand:+ start:236 stop:505 length:270 start_codon:yes stop_codon:yes gene_type:complete
MIILCNICEKKVEVNENINHRELKILQFIKKYISENNKSPTVREISKGVGISSFAGVDKYIYKLKEKQYITKIPYRARTIVLIKEVVCG